jgi:hypothetical protein
LKSVFANQFFFNGSKDPTKIWNTCGENICFVSCGGVPLLMRPENLCNITRYLDFEQSSSPLSLLLIEFSVVFIDKWTRSDTLEFYYNDNLIGKASSNSIYHQMPMCGDDNINDDWRDFKFYLDPTIKFGEFKIVESFRSIQRPIWALSDANISFVSCPQNSVFVSGITGSLSCSCITGFFHKSVGESFVCISCSFACEKCENQSVCTTCEAGSSQNGPKCVTPGNL